METKFMRLEDLTPKKLDALLDHVAAGKAIHPDYLYLIREIVKD
jgi:hypothetical protein